MIRRRTVILLGAVTLATTLGAAVAVIDRTGETRTAVQAERLFPALEDRAGDVQQVRVVRAADSKDGSVTLNRSADGWTIAERDGFPVRTDLVRKLLFDLGQLELIERKTADPARLDRLELRDVAENGAKGSRIVMTAAGGETLVDLYVGKRRESPTGGKPMVYVRRGAETQSYLAEGELELRGGPVKWLPREIVNIPKDTIVTAVLTPASGAPLRLDREGGDFHLAEIPAGRKIKSQYTVNNAGTVIDKLLFDDVRSVAGLTFDGSQGGAVYTTRDGLTVRLDLASDPAADSAAADPAPVWLRVQVVIGDGATDEARKLGAAAQAQTAGWAYRVSAYDLERLRATAESLTAPVEGS